MIIFYVIEIYVVQLINFGTTDCNIESWLLGGRLLPVSGAHHGTTRCTELILRKRGGGWKINWMSGWNKTRYIW